MLAGRRLPAPRRLAPLGLAGLVLAALTSLPGGAEAVAAATGVVPGLGLLRDAQKWLAPFVVLAVLAVATALDRGSRTVARHVPALAPSAAVVALVTPFLLLPDGTSVVHRVLAPATYPADFAAVARVVDGGSGVLASAPWRPYRRYPWASDYPTFDPAGRWFDVRVTTSDALVVGGRTLAGEDPLAARVGAALDPPGPGTASALGAEGVRWVLVTRGDPGAEDVLTALEAAGARTVVDGADLALVELPGPVAARSAGPGVAGAPRRRDRPRAPRRPGRRVAPASAAEAALRSVTVA